MNKPILSVQNLVTQLQGPTAPYPVVNNLSFDLHLGKTTAIVGESGCGKTMTAFSIMRILPTPPALPSEGQVIYKGQNLLTLNENKMRSIRGGSIAMIFQDPSSALNPVFTIGNQLLEVVELHLKLYGKEAEERIIASLNEVGISTPKEHLNDYPHQLSGGMKQRIMIAMALLCEPDILIADEPTTALDVTIQAQVLDLIRHLQKKIGMALLLITHDMGIVAEMADDVIVMYASESIEQGNVLEIFDRPAHPYTKGLFASFAGFKDPSTPLRPIKGTVPSPEHYPHGCKFHPRCPYVMDKCKKGKIPFFTIDESATHQARCLLYDASLESNQKKINQ